MMALMVALLALLVGGIVAVQALERRAPVLGEEERRANALRVAQGRDRRSDPGWLELERRRRERLGE